MLAFCCGDPTLRYTLNIRFWIALEYSFNYALVLMYKGIPNVLRVKFTSQRFLNQIRGLPVPHWIQNSADSYTIGIYTCVLAFCCVDPTLRTSQRLTYIIPTWDDIYLIAIVERATGSVLYLIAIVERSTGSVLYPRARKQGYGCSQKSISSYTYKYFMQHLSNYINVHMKAIIATDNHLENHFLIFSNLTI